MREINMYYTYILKCVDNSYYVGSTENVIKRLKMHNSGKGADFTTKRNPVVLVWLQSFGDKKQALLRELEIKKFSRVKKEKLIFIKGSIWKHYKGNKYILLGLLGDLIVYSEMNTWKKYVKESKQSGQQCQVWLRDKNQWLDWIDKKNKLLRFNFGGVAQW